MLPIALTQSKSFFELPAATKLKYRCNSYNLGYTSYQDETVAPEEQSCGDTKEGFYFREENGRTVNVWPNEDTLLNWREIMTTYHSQCTRLGHLVMSLIAQSLNLEPDAFNYYTKDPTAIARLIRYGTVPSDASAGVYGSGPHTDYGLITLLATNGVSGLQIYHQDEWLSVIPSDSLSLVVNIGDCLQLVTNNQLPSTRHRVLIAEGLPERYSIAFFFEPNEDCLLRPLQLDLQSDKTNEDRSVEIGAPEQPLLRFGDYLRHKYLATNKDFQKVESQG